MARPENLVAGDVAQDKTILLEFILSAIVARVPVLLV